MSCFRSIWNCHFEANIKEKKKLKWTFDIDIELSSALKTVVELSFIWRGGRREENL